MTLALYCYNARYTQRFFTNRYLKCFSFSIRLFTEISRSPYLLKQYSMSRLIVLPNIRAKAAVNEVRLIIMVTASLWIVFIECKFHWYC